MRKILLGIVLSIVSFNLAAQGIGFNVYADPQFSWFSSDENEADPNGAVMHIHTGLELNYYFQENYAFSFGLGINNIGGHLVYADTTYLSSKGDQLTVLPNSDLKHRVQYVSLPVGLILKTEELGYLTFAFQAGLMPLLRINANTTSSVNGFDKSDIVESTNLFNLNYFAGAHAEYRLGGNTALMGGIRWSSGLTDITKDDRANIRNNSISIHIGVIF